MSLEKIITLHPDGGKGAILPQDLYEQLKEAIIMPFLSYPEIRDADIEAHASKNIEGELEGKKAWYIEIGKQDLLARDALEYVPGEEDKTLRLKILFC